jgi:hypothetical protein
MRERLAACSHAWRTRSVSTLDGCGLLGGDRELVGGEKERQVDRREELLVPQHRLRACRRARELQICRREEEMQRLERTYNRCGRRATEEGAEADEKRLVARVRQRQSLSDGCCASVSSDRTSLLGSSHRQLLARVISRALTARK